MALVSRTRATLRSAEFGFFGVWVKTRTQTPRFCGLFCSAGLFVLLTIFFRPARTSWLIVGIICNLEMRIADCAVRPQRTRRPQSAILNPQCFVSGLKAANGLAPENPTDPKFDVI